MPETTVEQWLKKAESDEQSFFVLSGHSPDLKDTAAFHAQQAVEKWLKGLLIFKDIEPKKTHDLIFLLDFLVDFFPELDTNENYGHIKILDQYAVEIRYPSGLKAKLEKIYPPIEEVETAMLHFRKICLSILIP